MLPKTSYWRLLPAGMLETVRIILSLIFVLIMSPGDSSHAGKQEHTDTHTHIYRLMKGSCAYMHMHINRIYIHLYTWVHVCVHVPH